MTWTLLAIAVKVLVTGGTIVAASIAAERAGPVIGGLIISLPISAGPGYLFLAMTADDAFIARSVLWSSAVTAVTAIYILILIRLAPRLPAALAIGASLVVWFLLAFLLYRLEMSWQLSLLLNLASFAVTLYLTRDRISTRLPVRRATGPGDLLVRAALAGTLVAAAVTLSEWLGPRLTGASITFPIAITTLTIMSQWRYGGEVTSRMLRGVLSGMPCFVAWSLAFHLMAVPLGAVPAAFLALGASLVASAVVLLLSRRRPATARA